MTAAAVVLKRDPRCRGSIGGRYYFTDTTGRRWLVEGSPGVWMVGLDVDAMTPAQCQAYIARGADNPGAVVLSLAAARTWLAANTPAAGA